MRWSPDTCKDGQCILDIDIHWTRVQSVVQLCNHHQKIRDKLETDHDLLQEIMITNRVKNYASYEIAKDAGVPTDDIVWEIDDDDNVRIKTDQFSKEIIEIKDVVDRSEINFDKEKVIIE